MTNAILISDHYNNLLEIRDHLRMGDIKSALYNLESVIKQIKEDNENAHDSIKPTDPS